MNELKRDLLIHIMPGTDETWTTKTLPYCKTTHCRESVHYARRSQATCPECIKKANKIATMRGD